jgi:hypothetical protein
MNAYVSNAAIQYYDEIIQSFSPREVATLINKAVDRKSTLGRRVASGGSCRRNFRDVLGLIDIASIPNSVKADYDRFIQ